MVTTKHCCCIFKSIHYISIFHFNSVKRESKPVEKEYGLILSNRYVSCTLYMYIHILHFIVSIHSHRSTSSHDSNNISSQRKKRRISPPPSPPSTSKEEEVARKPKRAQYSEKSDEGETGRAFSHKERREKEDRERRREKDGGTAKRSTKDEGRHKKEKERVKREREYDDKEKESRSMKKKYSKVSSHKSTDDIWVSSNLRVRIIDKEFNGGKYYNKKVIIIIIIIYFMYTCMSVGIIICCEVI